MLLVLMYHKIVEPNFPERFSKFRVHLEYLKAHYPIVYPGEKEPSSHFSVCLCFDDAYYDFYHHVYPLLHELDMKAVLAIPTAFIQEKTAITSEQRLGVPYPDGLSSDKNIQAQAPLCTWEELGVMVKSGRVYPASHSHTHTNMSSAKESIWEQEIEGSKQLLETKLNFPVDTFVYPYGRLSPQTHRRIRQNYRYAFRIGSALNRDWSHPTGLIYRIDADEFWLNEKTFGRKCYAEAYLKYWLNRIRGR